MKAETKHLDEWFRVIKTCSKGWNHGAFDYLCEAVHKDIDKAVFDALTRASGHAQDASARKARREKIATAVLAGLLTVMEPVRAVKAALDYTDQLIAVLDEPVEPVAVVEPSANMANENRPAAVMCGV